MNKLKEIFKRFLSLFRKEGDYKKPGIYPKDDWHKILVFIFIAVFILIIINILFYSKVNNGYFWRIEQLSDSKMDKINSVKMKEMINDFKVKEERFRMIKTGEKVTKDPYLNI